MPFVKQSFWLASFNSISVSGTPVVGSQPAIFDTGTTEIVGDTDSITNLFAAIDDAQPVGDGSYTSAFSGTADQLTHVHIPIPSISQSLARLTLLFRST